MEELFKSQEQAPSPPPFVRCVFLCCGEVTSVALVRIDRPVCAPTPLCAAGQIFLFATSNNFTFSGNEVIRGIDCDEWTTTLEANAQ